MRCKMLIPHRSVRAGLGLPTSNYGGAEPRGDMDVMLSMRAQGLISSRSRGMNLNSGPGNNANGTSNPNSNPLSSPQPKTQTPSSPTSPKLPMSTLKGLFTGPIRPRTPSLVGLNGGAKNDEPSLLQSSLTSISPPRHQNHHNHSHSPPITSAGSHILNRLRGNSDARPLSPLGYTPSVTSISTTTNGNAGGNSVHSVDSPLSSGELERKILLDQTDTTASGASGSNWTVPQRKQSLISQQLTGLDGLMNSVSAPLQPPPWKKQSIGPLSVVQPHPENHVDLSGPDPITYQYLHTNMSAIESFGVHNTHPQSRHSTSGTRPSLDISIGRDSQGSGSVKGSGTGSGGSVKGSLGVLGVGGKKPRPPSWTSTSSISESTSPGPKRWSRQGMLPKRLTPPSGALPSIPVSGTEEEATTPRVSSPYPYSFDGERSPSRSSSYSTQNSHANSYPNSNTSSPQNGFPTTLLFAKRQSGSSFQSATSTSNISSQRTSTGSGTGTSGVGSYISRSALSIQNRLSLAPPQRPAPNTALPPTPTEQSPQTSSPSWSNPSPSPSPSSTRSSFRESLTQRAVRLSLAGIPQKTPPTVNLPLRPDDPSFSPGHRRSSSGGSTSVGGTSRPTTLYTIPGSPIPAEADPGVIPSVLTEKERQQNTLNLNLRQRLRMLSAPASTTAPSNSSPATVSSDSSVSTQLLAADQTILMHTDGEDNYGSVHTRLLVGEPITTMQNDPSFLLMATPVIPPPTPPPRLINQFSSPPSSSFVSPNPSSPLPTQTQFPSPSHLPPPQYATYSQRSPPLAPLPVPPRSPFRQLPKPPSPAPSHISRRSQPLPSPPPTQQFPPEITSLSPPPWKAARRTSVVPTITPKDDSAGVEQRDDRPPPAFMDSPPLLVPLVTNPVPLTPRLSSADSITNLSI